MDIKLDANGDLDITGDTLTLTEGADAVRQHVQIRLKFFLGEWFLDRRIGVAWFETIFQKGVPLSLVRAILRKVIIRTPGIVSIVSFDLTVDPVTRKLQGSFEARLEDGIVDGDEPFLFEFDEFIIEDQLQDELATAG